MRSSITCFFFQPLFLFFSLPIGKRFRKSSFSIFLYGVLRFCWQFIRFGGYGPQHNQTEEERNYDPGKTRYVFDDQSKVSPRRQGRLSKGDAEKN